jgi:seryl-tRNA synthetase
VTGPESGILTSPVECVPSPLPTQAAGVWLFPDGFERLVADIRTAIDALGDSEGFTRLSGPPVISRETIERAGYAAGFPHLLGTVHRFADDDKAWRELRHDATSQGEWHRQQQITDVVLAPAACFHVFAQAAGAAIGVPVRFAVESYCYRHEATSEPGRLRSFRMKEFVFLGTAEECVAWRERWLHTAEDWLRDLGLPVRIEAASDPFFGTEGRLLKRVQAQQQLKWELTVPTGDDPGQAVASANYHMHHFGKAFGIRGPDGQPVHSACTGFGLERIALAVLRGPNR